MLTHILCRLYQCLNPKPKKPPPGASSPQRVVILGGGVAGVAAAFWLTAPQQNNRFQVTLCTQGWRLGGKCASGRNQARSNSIEEHGLHLLMGCYQNAFATIRACYQEWQRPATHPFKTWQDAFLPQREITLMEKDGPGGAWATWPFSDFPQYPGEPGDSFMSLSMLAKARTAALRGAARTAAGSGAGVVADPTPPPGPDALILRMTERMRTLEVPPTIAPDYQTALDGLSEAIRKPTDQFKLPALGALENVNNELAAWTGPEPIGQAPLPAPRILSAPVRAAVTAATVSRAAILANLGISIGLGYLRDVQGKGAGAYDTLNAGDFRAWLKGCGATDATLASAPIRALYDLAFAFPDGDSSSIATGSMAAGVALRFALEVVFGYQDAPVWRMAAGTGDTVFVPLYQVLLERGVDIQFFQRVTALRPTADGTRVGEIDIMIQASTVGGAPYRPLAPVGALDSWPNQPDWTQLVGGTALASAQPDYESSYCNNTVGNLTLTAGTDFDLVIAAVPPTVLSTIAAPLVSVSPAWNTALSASRSVATAAFQLWMRPPVSALGQPDGTVLTSFAESYDSWGDMTSVLAYESWAPGGPQSLAYFCGCMQVPTTGTDDPATMQALAESNAQTWLDANIQSLWPGAPPVTEWTTPGGAEIARYDKANFDISDLYVQTPSGNNVASRFAPGRTAGFTNLYVVGDWTKTRFSGGCFESAVESAMLSANAIGGFPPLAEIKTS